MLNSIPGSRGEGSDLPGCHQTTEVVLTKNPPEKSGCMHMDKKVTKFILVMLPPQRAPRQPR